MRVLRTRRGATWLLFSGLFVLLVLLGIASDQRTAFLLPLLSVRDSNDNIYCYLDTVDNPIEELDPKQVVKDTSIFFHETSCHSKGAVYLSARQACAVESAAKMNPGSHVYVLYPSPLSQPNATRVDPLFTVINAYSNVRVRHLNAERYFQGSPLEEWYKSGYLQASQYPRSHASDLFRYLTLWKFGGIYLDLDVVVVKSFEKEVNFAGAESSEDVAAGVLSFSTRGLGRKMATECLLDLKKNFRGYDWGYNGPGVITRVLKATCNVDKVTDMTLEQCKGFRVFPPEAFYPIPWREWKLYFDAERSESTMRQLENSYVIHVWNKFSITANVTVGSKQPYGLVASKYCPVTYANSGAVF
ncbi:lactosylceramide 4-alpha-galactosyltransferase isoform X1 [Nilaparvata lugens]|uniref:lactosylceramide 4-alpha-galactosyltransferase isoform X2 n=1 Tax=Nilaparvata lugens TaxID=108931 RepID=UPI000B983D80|nr:lactosylceramide 4-alpha-galactosyltransferase isoform X2 [Nilaparvata lugens]XP_039290814.1 lactosylceramide 4-alpha-galactosyltransferase isoform X1 [Nilaparvata lugens]XP_039290815.1 lactosylceramide 4-alpha-galactosyltransferase isoform X1 [Nilaparvata lugens]